jgi:hypothetical protein
MNVTPSTEYRIGVSSLLVRTLSCFESFSVLLPCVGRYTLSDQDLLVAIFGRFAVLTGDASCTAVQYSACSFSPRLLCSPLPLSCERPTMKSAVAGQTGCRSPLKG